MLQVLFNKRTSPAQEELADHSGLEATPLPTFQTKDLKITALVKQHTGALNNAADQEEWLWRRLTEIRSTISAGRNPHEGLKALTKGVNSKTNLKLWQEALGWLRSVHAGPGLAGYEVCVDQLVDLAKSHKTRSCNADKGRANTEWHTFVAKACEKGAGFAHYWTKSLEAQPLHTATLGGHTSSDPAHRLQAQVRKWTGYWGSRNNDNDELIWPSSPMQERMSTEGLRSTALTFPTHTSARDGWHPRLFAKLSEPALAALSDLFWAIDFYGDFPPCFREVLIRLIPRPASQDARPIGLYKGFFRLWARARAQTIRDWTTAVPEYAEIVNMLPGRCTADAV